MDDRDRASAPTAVQRPGASSPDTVREPSSPVVRERPSPDGTSGSAFDPPRDRFETKSELGRGGMGRVDEAYDRALGRPVAIKHMLSPGGTELARFEREARITARLEHPGIVPIHDAGRSADGTPYYVMRRVDGQPLSDMTAGRSLDERLALVPNLLAACDAAGFAHARGVVHRDIKPTNILIGPFGETLLIDWGLARELGDEDGSGSAVIPSQPELTRAGTVAGTPGFMSPEQARGESVDARADVFALGATLFYVLTGQLPWGSTSATEMVNVVGAGRTPSWNLLPAEMPADLRAVLEKAMASEAADRYPDAGALAADLRRYVTGNLVGARHYGWLERAVRFVRKHRAAVGVAGVSLVLVAVIAVISVRRVIAERDDARAARALAEQRAVELADSADGLLVDNARQLASQNPIAAITKLRRLRPESKRWREAWAAASTAWSNGIPFGFVNEPGPAMLETAADSRHVLVTSLRTGTLVVVDLVGRSRREVARIGRVFHCVWLESPTKVLCQREADIVVVDVATGTTRSFDLSISSIVGDRGSRVLLMGRRTRTLFELRAGQDTPTVLLDNVDELTASRDLSWLVVRRGTDIVLYHGDRSWPLPWNTPSSDRAGPVVEVSDGMVMAVFPDEIRVVRVVDDRLEEFVRTPRTRTILGVAAAAGFAFLITVDGVTLLDPEGGHVQKQLSVRSFYSTPHGFVVHGSEGELVIRDDVGWFHIGPRPLSYRSVDQSADGRFLCAIADGGDLVIWDLEGPRGHTIVLDKSEEPSFIDARQLWLVDSGGGIFSRALPSGTQTQIADSGPMANIRFDPLGRFVAYASHGDPTTTVYDMRTGTRARLDTDPRSVAIDDVGLTYLLGDRTLWRWISSDSPPTKVGQFPVLPSFVAIAQDYAVGVAGTREIMRLHTPSARVERIAIDGEVLQVAVEYDGRTWLLTETQAWRWDVGAATAISVLSPEPSTQLVPLPRGVLLASSKSLTLVDGDSRRVLSSSAGQTQIMADGLIASLDANRELGVIDLATGQRVGLPIRGIATHGFVAHGNRLGTVTGATRTSLKFTYWDLDVPREPAALQAWLATITNARPIPDSDAVAWPTE